jgi:glycine/D-amino acid oxidase-like deaminating enzyme
MASRTRGFWLAQALAQESAEQQTPHPLPGDRQTDVCIVGGGFTGLWPAIFLKQAEPGLDVTIIEKDICGGGASGRNGGFCMTWMSKASTLVKICGVEDGAWLLKESEDTVRRIGAFTREKGIDCQFRQEGWIWTASNDAQRQCWSGTVEELAKIGLQPFKALSKEQLDQVTGSSGYVEGIFEAGVATVQPALLARGLRRICLALGVRVFEGTRVVSFSRRGKPRVATDKGTITAGKMVLALNSWAHELPEFRRSVLPVQSDVIATEPIPDELKALGLERCVAISDSRQMVNYYRTTVDSRLIWGYGGGPIPAWGRVGEHFDGAATREDEVRGMLSRFYPSLRATRIGFAWRGPANRTSLGLPFFGHLNGHPDILYGHGYSGNGVGPSFMGGRILSALVRGNRDRFAENGLVDGSIGKKLPAEPFRYVGSLVIRPAAMRVDAAHDRGRPPRSIDQKLVSLVPSGLTPTKGRKIA